MAAVDESALAAAIWHAARVWDGWEFELVCLGVGIDMVGGVLLDGVLRKELRWWMML